MNDKHTDKPQETPVLEVTIEKLVTGGDGLARHEGQAVFVPLTAPGDRVRVAVKERRKGFVRATVEEILEPGPGRQEPPCPWYGQCGGCDMQHLDPEHQRSAKADIVADCFKRLGKMDVSELLAGPEAGMDLGYRNRIRVFSNPVNHYGLMRRGTHEVVPFDACGLMPEQFNKEILPWLRMLPPAEQIVVRMDGRGGWLVSVFGPPQRLKVMRFNNLPLWGRDYLIHELAGHKYRVGAQSFFQGNHSMTEEALTVIRSWITELKNEDKLGVMLGDLFCGVGLAAATPKTTWRAAKQPRTRHGYTRAVWPKSWPSPIWRRRFCGTRVSASWTPRAPVWAKTGSKPCSISSLAICCT